MRITISFNLTRFFYISMLCINTFCALNKAAQGLPVVAVVWMLCGAYWLMKLCNMRKVNN